MKASRFTDAQKAFIIKQMEDGTSVAEVCRKAGIETLTIAVNQMISSSKVVPDQRSHPNLHIPSKQNQRCMERRSGHAYQTRRAYWGRRDCSDTSTS